MRARCRKVDHVFDESHKRCHTCYKTAQRRWYERNRKLVLLRQSTPDVRQYQKERNQEKKRRVFEAYGGCCCVCCGETNPQFLTIDHIDGTGNKHRTSLGHKGRGTNFYTWLETNDYPDGYQVLCFNCNCGRSVNGGVCPHVTERITTIGHNFESSRPEHSIQHMHIPSSHAHADQKHDKMGRSPMVGQLPSEAGLSMPELEPQVSGSGHGDSEY